VAENKKRQLYTMPRLHRGFLDTVKAYRDAHEQDPYLRDPETVDRINALSSEIFELLERADEDGPTSWAATSDTDAA
jgi:hypothetical protein